ncbi:MAG: RCC1 repeat-containing protein, partial [Chloroflexota bacterium]
MAVAAGQAHSLALKIDETVWAWGHNAYGQLGNAPGGMPASPIPVKVSGLTDVKAVAAGGGHSLALKSDGSVWAWGYNYYGQLGDTTPTNRFVPVMVGGLTGAVA